jgi:hypothetical protein
VCLKEGFIKDSPLRESFGVLIENAETHLLDPSNETFRRWGPEVCILKNFLGYIEHTQVLELSFDDCLQRFRSFYWYFS